MNDIAFEWNEEKSLRNKGKHGVSFEEAQTVLVDDNALILHDPDHSQMEDRYVLLGLSSNLRILVVCHSYRKKDTVVRIISARKATHLEQKQYWKRLLK
jgi:uncharacterized DUF497 family protein